MATLQDTTQSAATDVIVIGAGPTGLMTANLLASYGIRVTVLEEGTDLIDYPRGVGMDDETLRTFQTVKLTEAVLPHVVPDQLLVFMDRKGRDLARIAPPMGEFGWPRRNGFVQPLADKVLFEGLARFDSVDVQFSSTMTSLVQDADGVTVTVAAGDGQTRALRAAYVVGADGGRSATRKSLGIDFPGTTSPSEWLVIDIRDDPLGHPGSYVGADSRRPFASISIPHGIRRFEFKLLKGETEADTEDDGFIRKVLEPFIPRTAHVDIIRRRVYTHQSRLAARFRERRVFLAGDAAHLMPVWQGQGYNSGVRDAFNLSWKIAMVLKGQAADSMLDAYDQERRDHARAMIQLSTWVGRVISPTNRLVAGVRDLFFHGVSLIPALKSYIVQMRFKPMPTMDVGAITRYGSMSQPSPVGRFFPQPRVTTRENPAPMLLDDAVGNWFALLAWNNNPEAVLDADSLERARRAGIKLIWARPQSQLHWDDRSPGGVSDHTVIGDPDGTLKRWFDGHSESVVLLRPDRIVGGASPAFAASNMIRSFLDHVGASASGTDVTALRTATERKLR